MSMRRTFMIFGAVAVCFVAAFVYVGRTGAVDMKQKVDVVLPPGNVSNGWADKPVGSTTGIGFGETGRKP